MSWPESPDGDSVIAPAVLGDEPEHAEVFIPAEPASVDGQQVRLELRHTTEGSLALLTYTSLERLVEGCGDKQAWIKVPQPELQTIVEQTGAEVILEDFILPERRTGEE